MQDAEVPRQDPACGDASGNAHVASAPAHDHPDHAEWIATLRHLKALRGEATSEQNRHVPTRTVAARVRAGTGTARRRSADIRYVRRKRMLGTSRGAGTRSSSPRASWRTQSTSRTTSRSSFLHGTGLFGSRLSRPACASTERSGLPQTHFQLVTFHAVCTNGASFPVVYALVSDKSYATYKTVLDAVQHRADTMGLGNVFSRGTLTVSVDFEAAVRRRLSTLAQPCTGVFPFLSSNLAVCVQQRDEDAI